MLHRTRGTHNHRLHHHHHRQGWFRISAYRSGMGSVPVFFCHRSSKPFKRAGLQKICSNNTPERDAAAYRSRIDPFCACICLCECMRSCCCCFLPAKLPTEGLRAHIPGFRRLRGSFPKSAAQKTTTTAKRFRRPGNAILRSFSPPRARPGYTAFIFSFYVSSALPLFLSLSMTDTFPQ